MRPFEADSGAAASVLDNLAFRDAFFVRLVANLRRRRRVGDMALAPAPPLRALPLLLAAFCLGAGTSSTARRSCDASTLRAAGCPDVEHGVVWSEFLAAACELCESGQPCRRPAQSSAWDTLMGLSERIIGDPNAHYQCVPGVLASIIVIAQVYLVKAPPDFAEHLQGNRSLSPFPFRTAQYSLYANMVPSRLQLCDEDLVLRPEARNRFVPRAHPEDTGYCGLTFTDSLLVRRCRSRRKNKLEHLAVDTRKSARLFPTISCPAQKVELEEDLARRLQKYTDRADSLQCQDPRGMWRQEMSDAHKCVLLTVAHMMDFRPGQLVLDWGSGCGHKLSWAKMLFDVDGLGVELVDSAVSWTRTHSWGHFCQGDGRYLSWIPDGVFDHVISYAAIYHLSKPDQCSTGLQLIQKLRVGGKAYFGWNQGPNMSNLEWIECFREGPVEVELDAIEDGFLFPPSTDKAVESFLFQYPAYSLFITRLS
eukprot:TRINITY_DN50151_c0_g1_i1.p1 TRINITY_DN50151_c0_g1~~TRINITY_DN50151_c0_g1_i1.p1  ORF type:complete len:479 (+),score=93.60 TRINITY_DN50151_c0_g1_i1:2-1438(+)